MNLGLRKVKWFIPIHAENQGRSWAWDADFLVPKQWPLVSSPRPFFSPPRLELTPLLPLRVRSIPTHLWFLPYVCIITSWSQGVSYPNSNGKPCDRSNAGLPSFWSLGSLNRHCWHGVVAEWALANSPSKGLDGWLTKSSLLFYPRHHLWVNVSPTQDFCFVPQAISQAIRRKDNQRQGMLCCFFSPFPFVFNFLPVKVCVFFFSSLL